MGKTGRRLLTLFFMATILFFGCSTLLNAKNSIIDVVKNDPVTAVPSAVEAEMTDSFEKRNDWISINGLFQRLIGVTVIRDAGDIDVFKMSNGQLTYEYPDCDMTYAAEEVTSLDKYVKDMGMDFMYIQLPCKAYSDELMPIGTHTYGYADSDELISQLKANDVEVLDLREEIEKEGFDIPPLFFNTDHHWKPSTALWAAGVIADKFAKTIDGYTYDPKYYDAENYDRQVYKDWFLGSLGRRVGVYFGGVDDFETLIPKFDTDYHLYTESQSGGKPKNKYGTFSEALMKLSILDEINYFSPMTYFTYMGTEYRLCDVTNNLADNDKKILMIRDSFSCTLLPYLSLSAGEITTIDMRYHDELKIKEFIRDNDFDAVVVAYNPSMFREEGAFDFDR